METTHISSAVTNHGGHTRSGHATVAAPQAVRFAWWVVKYRSVPTAGGKASAQFREALRNGLS
jgi:hypothetical protein